MACPQMWRRMSTEGDTKAWPQCAAAGFHATNVTADTISAA
jgi:hypothetical protein